MSRPGNPVRGCPDHATTACNGKLVSPVRDVVRRNLCPAPPLSQIPKLEYPHLNMKTLIGYALQFVGPPNVQAELRALKDFPM